jgi:hypothetical protein
MRVGTVIALVIISGAVLVAGFRLSQSDSEVAVAALVSAPVKASISEQAMDTPAVAVQSVVDQVTVFDNDVFNYQLDYPVDWNRQQPSANVVIFQSPDQTTEVKIEAVGPLPADGLTAFVNRSLDQDIVISRQSLTVHGLPAERTLAFSDRIDGQVTTFYVDAGKSAYVITGVGEQKAIEQIARSFNAPEWVAQQ